MKHAKIPGFVEEIERDGSWFARLFIDDREYHAEMRSEFLDPEAKPGSLFTIHKTKKGRLYIYWIKQPRWTERDIINAHKEARRWRKKLGFDDG